MRSERLMRTKSKKVESVVFSSIAVNRFRPRIFRERSNTGSRYEEGPDPWTGPEAGFIPLSPLRFCLPQNGARFRLVDIALYVFLERANQFFRLFMVPGMQHCSGGPGPNTFDMLTALENWVEKGEAPKRVIASHSTGGVVDRTRPLCVYPNVAVYTGSGSTDDAANFKCRNSREERDHRGHDDDDHDD
jgi:hypothetical protein